MKKIWNWLDGKKTVIGAVAANIASWLALKGYLNDPTAGMVMGIIAAITGVGLAHKAVKARKEG
jgi:phage-related minor tail protein